MDRAVVEGYRLSPQQERLWKLHQTGVTLLSQTALKLEGPLNSARLREVLACLISRHETLRTTFERLPGMELPLRVVAEEVELSYCEVDLSELESTAQEFEIAACVEEQGWIGFDLEQGPVVRFCLLRLAARDHLLILTLPALCADSVSLTNLLTECGRLYANGVSAAEGEEEEAVQYVTFSEWQHELLADEEGVAGREFWQEQERAAIEALRGWRLPFESNARQQAQIEADTQAVNATIVTGDEAVEAERGWKTVKVTRELSAPEAERLLGRRAGESGAESSVGEVLLAGWEVLLWRLTGQAEVVVGVRCDGRKHEELREVVGPLADYLPISKRLKPTLRFNELLKKVSDSVQEACDWQEYYGGDSWGGRWPVGFDFNRWPAASVCAELRLTVSRLEAAGHDFKLRLSASVLPDERLRLEWHYDAHLFTDAAVERLADQYLTLLEGVALEPSARLGSFSLLGRGEREELARWNETACDYERDVTIHELFERQAAASPAALALIHEDQQLTYRELNERANRLARHLRRLGVGAETRVGVLLERSPEMIVSLLAILKAGGAYVPLDPTYPQERLGFMLEDAGVGLLLTQEELLRQLNLDALGVTTLSTDASREEIAKESAADLPLNVGARNLAYVIYTSGSTGRPKGVMIQHGSVANLLTALDRAVYEPLALRHGVERARVSMNAPTAFDASVKQWARLACGATLCLVPQEARADAEALLRFINETRLEVLDCTPSQLRMLVEAGLSERAPQLRAVLVGGEALDAGLWSQLRSPLNGGKLAYYNVYGPTECTVDATACLLASAGEEPNIGRPIANTHVHILDGGMEQLPVGIPGELYIGGAGVGRGYLNRPELTAERFVPNPYSAEPGARLYRTGDLARFLPTGEIEFIGRVDHQVKIRGFRIELGEIEAALSEHSSVKECVVIVREDVEGDKRLVAYLTAQPDTELSTIELRDHLRMCLPDYMVPSAFVMLERLPLTPNGKVDRHALPAPADVATNDTASLTSPRTPVEELLAGIWSRVLRIERVGVEQNFFELGGHSLLATQLISRVREAFGVELPLRTLFERPTVAALAESVEAALTAGQSVLAPPLTPVSREQSLPLSFAQQRLWFLNQLEPDSPFYNVPAGVRLTGALDVKALERALSEIVRRHEVLRTTFQSVDGEPVQVIGEAGEVPLPLLDLCSLPESEREAEAERLAQEEAARPFDLSTGPLLRTTLLRLAADEHILLVTLHHIVSDGWSTAILIRELSALYTAYSMGMESPLAELPVQYADYSVWQREWLQGEVLDEQLGYWRQQLAGIPEVLELPTDRVRPAVQSFRGASTPFQLSEEVSAGLQRLSREQGVTLFMTMLAAFQTLLSRYSGQAEIVVGTPIAGRTRSESEALIGFFVNTLALRTSVEAEMTFVELLRRVREVTLGAYAHQEVPFERLVEELAPRRELSHAPLFQVMLALQNAPVEQLQLGELELTPMQGESRTAKFDLTLSVTESGGVLRGSLGYNTDLFDAWRMQRMARHFEQLMGSIAQDAQQAVGEIELLGAEERHQQVVEWNETRSDYERQGKGTMQELFERQVAATPNAVAVSAHDEQLTYQELNERANQLAHYLQAQGVSAETRVAVLLERSPKLIITLLAILKAGGAYVPLDPAYPQERLRFMLEDAEVAVLVTQEWLMGSLPVAHGVPEVVCLERDREVIARESGLNVVSGATHANIAYVIYTSGSTGKPKGVMVEHGGLCNLAEAQVDVFGVQADDRIVQFASSSFDASIFEIVMSFRAGAELRMAAPDSLLPGEALTKLLQEACITTATLPPSALAVLPMKQLPALRTIIVAGEACSAELVERWAVNRRFFNAYGPTETTVWASTAQCFEDGGKPTIGRPVPNAQLYVLNKCLQPVPVGVAGELHISGTGLARGYLNRPQITAERFIPNPFSAVPGARMYRTGDLARFLPNGEIEFLGRLDHQVKVRGFRIELGEIEAALTEHEAIRECIVVAREDVEGDKRLVAYLSARDGMTLSAGELRAYLKGRMPEYMVPSAFVMLERLPLTPNGKVDRHALPAPADVAINDTASLTSPRTPVEELLAGIWSRVLRIERVGVEQNFFELGGHSLLATQLISRVREAFGVELPLRTLFERPTVAALAESVEAALTAGQSVLAPPLTPVSREQSLPLSFAQQRLWFLDQLDPGSTVYNCPVALRLTGALDVAALERALSEIVRRHEMLRTTFRSIDGAPVQVIGAAVEVRLPVLDLQSLPEREVEAQQLAQAEAARPFDLAAGPLLRTTLLRLAAEEHVLLVTLHHIVSDGWSTAILVRELSALYAAFIAGAESPLTELPVQYADYSVWQRNWLDGEVLDKQLQYWRQQLAGAPEVLELPTDRVRPAVQTFNGASISVNLKDEVSAGLQRLSRERGVTLYMTMLAAFKGLLSRYSGQEDIVIGSAIANRNRVETEPLIGFFVNTLALRTRLDGDPTFEEAVARVREVVLGAYTHQDLPFEKLISELQLQRKSSSAPVLPVGFALQNMAESGTLELPGLHLASLAVENRTAKNDLTLWIGETQNGLRVAIEYSTDLFEPRTVERVLEDFQRVLERIVADPAQRLSALTSFPAPALSPAPTVAVVENTGDAGDNLYERSNLSENQLMFWMAQQLQPEIPLFNMAAMCITSTAIDVECFRQAFQTLVNSSDAMRTVIEEIDGLPQQRVLDAYPYTVEYLDFSEAADPELKFHEWSRQRCRIPFKQEERFFDTALVKLADDKFAWFVSNHQIIADAWGTSLIMGAVSEFYGRALEGRLEETVALPSLQEYLTHERAHRRSPRYLKSGAYWKKKLADELVPLTFYGNPPQAMTARVERVPCTLGRARTERLKEVAAQLSARTANASLFSVLTAVFLAYLYRVSGNRQLSLGMPFHNRRSAFKETIGLFMQVLPVRVTIEDDETFASLIKKVTSDTFETMKHGQFSVSNPLQGRNYEVVANYLTATFPAFNGSPVRSGWVHTGYGNESLSAQIHDFDGTFGIDFDFDCETFDEQQRADAIRHFRHTLDLFLECSDRPLDSICLLTPEEEQHLLVELNSTSADFPADQTFNALFEAQAQKTPARTAVVCEGVRLTYDELNRKANRLAHQLIAEGVGAGVVVALLALRGTELLTAILAVFKAGGAYLPLDPLYPPQRLRQVLRQGRPHVLLADKNLFAKAQQGLKDMPADERPAVLLPMECAAQLPEHNPPARNCAADLAYVIYTSGSTGTPKGAMIEQRGMINHLWAKLADLRLSASDTVAQTASQCFDISVWQYLSALVVGGQVLIVNDEAAHDPAQLISLVARERVTILETVPSLLRAIVETLDRKDANARPSLDLRWLMVTGEALPPELCRQWLERYPSVPLMNAYGPTECSDDVTHYVVEHPPAAKTMLMPIGRPLINTQIYIVDRQMLPVPSGVAGELLVGGVGVGRGYLHDPQRTAERFIPNPFGDAHGARLYRTGDLARLLPNGEIEFLGRLDHQVKIRGFRIELGEIESALLGHEAVRECVVMAREDAEGDKRLVAYLTAQPDAELSTAELRGHLRERLPEYMIPSAFVVLDSMPLTPNGKIDRRALPAPEQNSGAAGSAYVAPRTPVEELLAGLWAEVLRIERIGVEQNFFELGGHSLLATQLVSRIRATFGVELPLRMLFERPTIAEFAKLVEQALQAKTETQAPGITATSREGRRVKRSSIKVTVKK